LPNSYISVDDLFTGVFEPFAFGLVHVPVDFWGFFNGGILAGLNKEPLGVGLQFTRSV